MDDTQVNFPVAGGNPNFIYIQDDEGGKTEEYHDGDCLEPELHDGRGLDALFAEDDGADASVAEDDEEGHHALESRCGGVHGKGEGEDQQGDEAYEDKDFSQDFIFEG